jgi:hypothetical protein
VVPAIVGAAFALAAWPLACRGLWGSAGVAFADGAAAEQKLTASASATDARFGASVAVSGDTAVVGAYGKRSAYVFVRSGGAWTQQQELKASDSAELDSFGWSVAISGDTALVGAFTDAHNGAESGSAYVFVRSGGTWTEQRKLTPADPAAGDRFGSSVALSGDTALIGAYGDDERTWEAGAAYVFLRSAGVWTQQQKLTASDGAVEDNFGRHVALSGDTALIGAPNDDDRGNNSGSAYVFSRSGSAWVQHQKVTASDAAADDYFGAAVSLSGNTALVSALTRFTSGCAYVYVQSQGLWSQQQKLRPADEDAWYFGASVALAGNVAVIGAPEDYGVGYASGAAYVFTRSGGAWSQRQKLIAPDTSHDDYFGSSVALSGDAAVVGATWDDAAAADTGSAWVWRLDFPSPPPDAALLPSDIAFARTAIGRPSSASIATLSNIGETDLNVTSVSIAGGDAADFRVAPGGPTPASSLSPTVAPGASVTFAVTFAPTSGGAKSAMLRVTSDDPVRPTIDITVRGEAAVCVASPTTATIGTVVTVQGAGFGTKKGKLLVLGGTKPLALKVTSWNEGGDGMVEGVVTKPLPAGVYNVCIAPRGAPQIVDPAAFTIAAPAVVSVSPASGPASSEVVVTCTALGAAKGFVYLQAQGATKRIKCKVTAWPRDGTSGTEQREARFRVPKKLAAGTAYDVVVVNKIGEGRAAGAFTAAP